MEVTICDLQSDRERGSGVEDGASATAVRENFHDRFLILDDKELYLIGASLKDLGKKCFGFTKIDASEIPGLKARM